MKLLPKSLLIALAVVAIALILVWFQLERTDDDTAAPSSKAEASALGSQGAPVSDGPDFDGTAESETTRPAATPDASAPLWQVIDELSVSSLPDYADHWSEEGRVLVSVSGTVEASRSWQVGDRLTLPLPQLGLVYQPEISELDDGPGGARAAVARTTDQDGRPLRSVVTAGQGNVFAWVETPEGSFELFGNADLGWLLPTTSMTANMDFSRRDYLLPGEDVSALFPETDNSDGGQ